MLSSTHPLRPHPPTPGIGVGHALLHTAYVCHLPTHTDDTGTAEASTEGGTNALLMHECRGELHSQQEQVHELLQHSAVNQVRDEQDHVVQLGGRKGGAQVRVQLGESEGYRSGYKWVGL